MRLCIHYRLAMLLPSRELFFLKTSAQRIKILPTCTHHYANEPQDLRDYWTKVRQILAVVNFSSAVLTQQSALRPVHPLSNEKGDIKKESNIGKTQARLRHRDAGRANNRHPRCQVVPNVDHVTGRTGLITSQPSLVESTLFSYPIKSASAYSSSGKRKGQRARGDGNRE